MDISVNKAATSFLNGKFEEWYSRQVVSQLQGHSTSDIQSLEIQPIDLSLARLKDVSAQWLVDLVDYLSNNPQIIVNGFIEAGIPGALDESTVEDTTNDGDETIEERSVDLTTEEQD